MRERSVPATNRTPARRSTCTVDVITVTPNGRQLAVLFTERGDSKSRDRWELPWDAAKPSDVLEDVARRIVRANTLAEPAWIDQVGAFGDGKRHPAESELSIAYVVVVAHGTTTKTAMGASWIPSSEVPPLTPRQRSMLDKGLATIRNRMDYAPIAFRLLSPEFTLSELQQAYELLLGRRLHKASFRRALQASYLVEPTDEWRSEGRGRPAQLFRYAPRKRKGARRPVRFDLLG